MLTAVRAGAPPERPIRVAMLCSRRAPGLADLIERSGQSPSYVLSGVLASDPECGERELLAGAGISLTIHDIRDFYRRRGLPLGNLDARREYDDQSARMLAAFHPDLVVLCGYLHIVTAPLLDRYPDRVINIHDSDLPHFPGLHAVRDAVFAGERVTRSTVHIAIAAVDVGPAVLRSWAFPTHPLIHAARRWGAIDILKAFAYAQREWMMRECWGQLLAGAIELFATSRVQVRDGQCLVDGLAGPLELTALLQGERSVRTEPPAQPAPAVAALS